VAGDDRSKEQGGPRGFQIVGEGDARPDPKPGIPAAISFGTFVLSLSTSTLVHLGEAPSPETGGAVPPNLPLARQTIEILEMLEQKTRGNLDDEEKGLLEAVLHDLRMRYVRATEGKD
jgi:hypothetical protein